MTVKLQGFTDFVQEKREEWQVPGLALGIVKNGEVIFSEGFGARDMVKRQRVTSKTVFPIGSATKAFTALSLGLLVEEGKLDWDVPIHTYLPGFRMNDPVVTERLTIRDILTHRTGLPGHYLLLYDKTLSRKDIALRMRFLEPSRDFRTVWQYQNLMYLVAGHIVDQMADCTWEDFVGDRILNRLGMYSSNFSLSALQSLEDHASPYMLDNNGIPQEIPFEEVVPVSSAGGMNSNIEDMCKWLLMQLGEGKYINDQLIGSNQIRQMHQPLTFVQPSIYKEREHLSYGMGWFVSRYRRHKLVYHGGNVEGFSALVVMLPQEDIGVVVLSNMNLTKLPEIIAYNVFDRLLGLTEIDWNSRFRSGQDRVKARRRKSREKVNAGRQLGTEPAHQMQSYAGIFRNRGYGTLAVELNDEQLRVKYGALSWILKHHHYDIFEAINETAFAYDFLPVSFITDVKGAVSAVVVQFEPELEPIVFERVH